MDKPYIYARSGPKSFDCSGLTYYCVKQVYGLDLLRTACDQGYDESFKKIKDIKDLEIGDLVYFNTNHSDKDLCDHTGIYIGNYEFIHASSAKRRVVISDLSEGYYNKNFSWGRRIFEKIELYYEMKETTF